jgi:hypothetical protein
MLCLMLLTEQYTLLLLKIDLMDMVLSLRRNFCSFLFRFEFVIASMGCIIVLLCLTISLYRQGRYLSFPCLWSSIRHNLIVSFSQIRLILANIRPHPAHFLFDHLLLLQLFLINFFFLQIVFLFEGVQLDLLELRVIPCEFLTMSQQNQADYKIFTLWRNDIIKVPDDLLLR